MFTSLPRRQLNVISSILYYNEELALTPGSTIRRQTTLHLAIMSLSPTRNDIQLDFRRTTTLRHLKTESGSRCDSILGSTDSEQRDMYQLWIVHLGPHDEAVRNLG